MTRLPFLRSPRLLALLLCTLLLLGACQQEEHPFIKIGHQQLSFARFQQELRPLEKDLKQLPIAQKKILLRQTLSQLIDQQLLRSEAKARGIQITPEEINQEISSLRGDYNPTEYLNLLRNSGQDVAQWKEHLRDRLLARKAIQKLIKPPAPATDQEISDYYQQHQAKYQRPEQVEAQQILLANQETGNNLRNQLLAGVPFAELAVKNSLAPDRIDGGALGLVTRGQFPPNVDKVLFALPAGQISPLIKSPYGVHIFLITQRYPARILALDEVKPQIRQHLLELQTEQRYKEWLHDLRKQNEVIIDWEQLDKLTPIKAE